MESDDQFRRFYKLDSALVVDRVNQVYLTGQSDRNYFSAKLYQFGGLLTNDTPQAESSTHPIIDYNYVFADPVLGGELKWNTNALSFTQNDVATINPITGQTANSNVNRIVTELKWRRRFTDAIGITYTPFADVRGDLYQFDNFTNPESVVIDPDTGTGCFVVLRRFGHARSRRRRRRCHGIVSLGRQYRERQPHRRTYRSDRRPPGERAATAVSGPRCAEPHL